MGAAPIAFCCPVGRRNRRWRNGELLPVDERAHRITRTGRTRPNPSRNRGPRSLAVEHEYDCSCGHHGWSRHSNITQFPLPTNTSEED